MPGRLWDLSIMIDDATNRLCSGILAEKPSFWPRLHVIRETVEELGFFPSMVAGSSAEYWYRSLPLRTQLRYQAQFARVMEELGIGIVVASSHQVLGWHGRMLRTLKDRLRNEMMSVGVSSVNDANNFLRGYWPKFNARFAIEATHPKTAFDSLVPEMAQSLKSIFCIKETMRIGHRHCVNYRGRRLQIPTQEIRRCGLEDQVQVCEYENGTLAVYHRSRRLGFYHSNGRPMVGAT